VWGSFIQRILNYGDSLLGITVTVYLIPYVLRDGSHYGDSLLNSRRELSKLSP
jgi:hypothetical protein